MTDPVQPTLAELNGLRQWTAWQTEAIAGRAKPTKIPYQSGGAQSRSNDPRTWLTLAEASAVAATLPKPYGTGGVGLWLGVVADRPEWSIGGFDCDSCIGADGLADWAAAALAATETYAETSPSGGGVKLFFAYRTDEAAALRGALGIAIGKTGRKWARKGGGSGSGSGVGGDKKDHPEAIEAYLERRYFAVTGDAIGIGGLRTLDADGARTLLAAALPSLTGRPADATPAGNGGGAAQGTPAGNGGATGEGDVLDADAARRLRLALDGSPALARLWGGDVSDLTGDSSRSGVAFRLAALLRPYGFTKDETHAIVATHAIGGEWLAEKGDARGGYEWDNAWRGAGGAGGSGWIGPIGEAPAGLGSDHANPFAVAAVAPKGTGLPRSVGAAATGDGSGAKARPVIQVKAGHLAETTDAAEAALLAGGFAVYTRDKWLVTPSTKRVRVRGGAKATVAGLHRVTPAALRDMLSRAATWCKWDGRGQKLVPCDPPPDVAAALLERPGPRPFVEVAGLTTTPGLREDGSIGDAIGLDQEMGIHRVEDASLRMPAGWNDRPPVRSDAEAALALLRGLLGGYPFCGPADESVAVAMILTCMCRGAVPTAPIFALSATAAGTGKTHLVDLGSVIATGMRCPAAAAGEKEDETEKRLGGLIYAGYPIVSLDNVNGVLRSTTLNQASTSERLRIRLLGSSDMPEVECRAVLTANGNGLQLSGDLLRRTLPCRLDAQMEQPETRSFAFDPVARVEADRGPYVAAALTALRAHAEAGFPGVVGLPTLGSYEAWSRHVRGTLVWLGMVDPASAMDKARDEDPDVRLFRDVLSGWFRRFGDGAAYSVKEASDLSMQGGGALSPIDGQEHPARDLFDAFLRISGERGVVNTRKLGIWFGKHDRRINGTLRLERAAATNVERWKVTDLSAKTEGEPKTEDKAGPVLRLVRPAVGD